MSEERNSEEDGLLDKPPMVELLLRQRAASTDPDVEHHAAMLQASMQHVEPISLNWKIFFTLLVYHVLSPFIYPLVYVKHPHLYNNLGFGGNKFLSTFQWVTCVAFWYVMVVLMVTPSDLLDETSLGELAVACGLHVLHKTMVASKYAYLSPEKFGKMLQPGSEALRDRLQLLNSWVHIPPDIIREEVHSAANYVGVSLYEATLHVESSQLERWMDPEQDKEFPTKPSKYSRYYRQVCVGALVSRLVCIANRHATFKMLGSGGLFRALAAMLSVLPFLLRLILGHSLTASPPVMIASLLAAILRFLYFGILLQFLYTGLLDFRRRYYMLQCLEHMITRRPEYAVEEFMRPLPHIDLSLHDNILGWLITRQVTASFGVQFQKRLLLYASYTFVLSFLILCMLVIDVILLTIGPVSVAVIIFTISCMSAFLIPMAFYGGLAQDQYATHVSAITRLQYVIRELMADSELASNNTIGATSIHLRVSGSSLRSPKDIAQTPAIERQPTALSTTSQAILMHCDRLLDSTIKLLKLEENEHSLRLLGLDPNSIVRSAVVMGATSIGLAARQIVLGS